MLLRMLSVSEPLQAQTAKATDAELERFKEDKVLDNTILLHFVSIYDIIYGANLDCIFIFPGIWIPVFHTMT